MSALPAVALRTRAQLVERSAIARVRLRRDACALRESLGWKRAAIGLSAAPIVRRAALAIALSLVGMSRVSRLLMIAGRVALAARVAGAVFRAVREARARRDVRQRTDVARQAP